MPCKGRWQFVERLADEAAQPHDCLAADQNVKTELALEFFQRRGRGVAQDELFRQRFFQAALQSFSRKFRATFVCRTNRDEDCVFERRKIAAFAEL